MWPFPQEVLHSDHWDHSVSSQSMGHSGSMHFSACSSSSLQSPSSAADFSILCRVRIPFPHVTLQSLHSDHGDRRQGIVWHSGIMHFSASVVSALHIDPSAGVILIILCRLFIPVPQLALHSSHSPHSVTRQLLGEHSSFTIHFSVSSVGTLHIEPSSGNCFTYLSLDRVPIPQETLQGDHVIQSDIMQVEPSSSLQPGPMHG